MRWISLILIILFTDACVDPLSIPVLNNKRLVVDGLVTNEDGPHEVAVYYTFTVNKKPSFDYPEAHVSVRDDRGNVHTFTAYDSGIHRSAPDFRASVGQTYTLEVVLGDGTAYRSTPQKVYPAGAIENVYAEFQPESINLEDEFAPNDSWAVFVDADGEGHGLFRWRTTGTYLGRTYPEYHAGSAGNPPVKFADPLPCANVGHDSDPTDEFPGGICSCCNCWVTEYSSDVKISQARYVDQDKFSHTFVGRIPFDGRRFYERYDIEVEQLSLSGDVYEFWKAAKSQDGNSSIFQTNMARVKGNILSVSEGNSSDEVLGYFSASAITRSVLSIDRFDAPVKPPLADSVFGDCRNYFKGSTNHKPPFW